MSKAAEKLISEAIERGEFKNLKGEGKPIDLDAYFSTPAAFRLGYSVLKSNEFVPEEVDRMREIAELKGKIAGSSGEGEEEKKKLKKLLSERELALALILERNKRRR
jgi:hypothetical protein